MGLVTCTTSYSKGNSINMNFQIIYETIRHIKLDIFWQLTILVAYSAYWQIPTIGVLLAKAKLNRLKNTPSFCPLGEI